MDPSKLTELTLLSKYIVETYAAAPLAQLHLGVDQDGNLKPSGLTLVSKFYPVGTSGSSLDGSSVTHAVANYSYPRNDSAAAYTTDRPSTGKSARSSVGSNGSSPGLTDDRTISEVSFDDDYQCHTYTSRLWDGFWTQEALQRSMEQPGVPSKNHYPATIPPPLNPSRRQLPAGNQGQPWPLPESEHWGRQMYSAPVRPPSPRTESPSIYSGRSDTTRLSPETTSSEAAFRSRREPPSQQGPRPIRPPRPNHGLLAPSGYRSAVSQGHNASLGTSAPKNVHLVPPLAMKSRALQPMAPRTRRPSDGRPGALHAPKPSMYNMATSSCTKLAVPDVKTPATRRPRQHKSMTDLLNRPLPPLPEPDPEPRSVFEDDSSDEDQDSEHHRSFYLFHGRSSSDNRRPSKSTGSTTTGTGQRNRALPGVPPPVPPKRQQPHQQHQQQPNYHFKKPSSEWKRQDSNVFGRVFGHAQRH